MFPLLPIRMFDASLRFDPVLQCQIRMPLSNRSLHINAKSTALNAATPEEVIRVLRRGRPAMFRSRTRGPNSRELIFYSTAVLCRFPGGNYRSWLEGKPNSLRRARVLRPGGELLHPSLDDAEPALGGRLPAHRQKRFAPEGVSSVPAKKGVHATRKWDPSLWGQTGGWSVRGSFPCDT